MKRGREEVKKRRGEVVRTPKKSGKAVMTFVFILGFIVEMHFSASYQKVTGVT